MAKKKPFSAKQKKAQLQEKRRRKEQQRADAVAFDDDGKYAGKATLVAPDGTAQGTVASAKGPALPAQGVVLMNEQPHNPRTRYNPNRCAKRLGGSTAMPQQASDLLLAPPPLCTSLFVPLNVSTSAAYRSIAPRVWRIR